MHKKTFSNNIRISAIDLNDEGFDPHEIQDKYDPEFYYKLLEDFDKQELINDIYNKKTHQIIPLLVPETDIPESEIPLQSKEIKHNNARDLIYTAINNMELVSFDYYYVDNKLNRRLGRVNTFAGRYLFEPYFTIMPSTGNELVVGWHVKSHDEGEIKSFALSGIKNGIRYQYGMFQPRSELVEKGNTA